MHPDKKLTKEDTWKSDDLRRHLKAGGHDEDFGRDEYERRYRLGESVERRHKNPERDARKERAYPRDSTRQRTRDVERERHHDRRKEGSRDRKGSMEEREKDRRKDQDRVQANGRYREGDRDRLDKRLDKDENESRERVKEREKERTREREKKARETSERDGGREREREERVREQRPEKDRQRGEESGEGQRRRERDLERRARHTERGSLKESAHHKDGLQEQRREKERKERPTEREQSEQMGDREYSERHRKEKERETKLKPRVQHDSGESQRHKGESREAERERAHREHRRADREREGEREREKRRERRHREGAGPERDPTKQTGTNKSSSSDVRAHKENRESANTEVAIEEATPEVLGCDGAQSYEEDFEDYEEDFEEVDESEEENKRIPSDEECDEREDRSKRKMEVEAIQRAMDEENKRVGSAHPRLSAERNAPPRTSEDSDMPPSKGLQQPGRFMNFVAAKHREFSKMVAAKQKKRSAELLRMIELDVSVTVSLLDLPPVNEYDMYIKSFGTTNTKQAYVQCNEDNTDRDIQTEEIETSERWTQHPADWNVVCGGPSHSLQASDESRPKLNIDSQRLAKFLHSASQVVAVLLEESRADKQSPERLKTPANTLSFSDGCLPLNTNLPFLCGRPVSLVHFSQVQRQTMLSVHGPSAQPGAASLDHKTVVCVWNIWEPSRPHKVLVYESEVNCCCFSPGKATLVFAGTSVGSVVLWDLREQSGAHYTLRIGEDDWTLRQPTFSTDAVLAASGHMSSVISVEAIPAIVGEGLRPDLSLFASDEESSGLSFQLASLDENGVLNTWVVLELPKANDAGSQTDLGLRPGGKVKLLHSSTVLTSERSSSRDPKKTTPLQTLLLKLLPSDSNHFFIGTNMGVVNHGTRHGLKTTPKFYKPQVVGFRPVTVTSIDFSPFGEPVFLVGCGDGSIRLHTVQSELPLMEWSSCTAGQPVVSVRWAQTRPAVFCVLDAASCLHIWDLLEKDFEPVITEKINADSVTAMAVFGDPAKQNTSGIALAMQSGKIEMQCFSKRFTVPESDDLEKLKSMVLEAF